MNIKNLKTVLDKHKADPTPPHFDGIIIADSFYETLKKETKTYLPTKEDVSGRVEFCGLKVQTSPFIPDNRLVATLGNQVVGVIDL